MASVIDRGFMTVRTYVKRYVPANIDAEKIMPYKQTSTSIFLVINDIKLKEMVHIQNVLSRYTLFFSSVTGSRPVGCLFKHAASKE